MMSSELQNQNNDLTALRADALEKDRCFSKSRLRNEFRMKPKPNAVPVSFYKNGYGGEFGVYKIADCVPMRDTNNKPPSEKQLRAREILAIKARMRSNQIKASNLAIEWLAEDPYFLDTESTGVDSDAQIIEIAIIDSCGTIQFESRLRPTVPIEPEALNIHGITENSLAPCPSWPEVSSHVRHLLDSRPLVIFNSEFDTRLLRQTASAFSESTEWIDGLTTHCAMYLAADVYGSTNRHGTISLASAVTESGVVWRGTAHGAVADTLATIDVVRAMASIKLKLDHELSILESSCF